MAEFLSNDELSIRPFFDDENWEKLSLLERKRFCNMLRNYEVLKSLGMDPKPPGFMSRKKKAPIKKKKQSSKEGSSGGKGIMADEGAISSSKATKKKGSTSIKYDPKDFDPMVEKLKEMRKARKGNVISAEENRLWDEIVEKLCRVDWSEQRLNISERVRATLTRNLSRTEEMLESLRDIEGKDEEGETVPAEAGSGGGVGRYPRRNVPKVCYTEEEVSSEDEYLYCEFCGEMYDGHCPVHGPMTLVPDKKVPPGHDKDHARKTCPDFLSVCRSGMKGAGLGVWTEVGLDVGLVFGPYRGKTVKAGNKEAKDGGYGWAIRQGGRVTEYIEGSDTSISNWLRYVNCAPNEEVQNLVSFQYRGRVYYRTYKPVRPFTELMVWYGAEYARDLGLQVTRGGGPVAASGHSAIPPSVWSSLPRALPVAVATGGTSSSDAGRRESGVRTRKTGVKRPELPGVIATLPADYGKRDKRRVFTCFRCCVEFDALWKFVRHKKTHSDENASEDAETRGHRGKEDGKGDGSHEDEIGASASEGRGETPASIQPSESRGTRPKEEKSRCGVRGREENAGKEETKHKHHDCPHCEYQAAYSTDLKRHVSAIHRGERPHPCPHCDYRATRSFDLRRHVSAVHVGEKSHQCPQCDYRSAQSSHLKQHVSSTHLGEKCHQCPHCEHRATRSSNLKLHVSAVHLGQRPFKCTECDYRAARSSSLKSHVRSIHGQQPEPGENDEAR